MMYITRDKEYGEIINIWTEKPKEDMAGNFYGNNRTIDITIQDFNQLFFETPIPELGSIQKIKKIKIIPEISAESAGKNNSVTSVNSVADKKNE